MGNESGPSKPLGGFFMVIGGFVGAGYGFQVHPDYGGIFGFIIGLWLGWIVENIIYRLLVIALLIIMILARQAFFNEVFSHLEYDTDPLLKTDVAALVMNAVVPTAWAEEEKDITLRAHIASEILHATAHTSMTKKEKLVTKRCESINQYLEKKPGEPIYDALHYSCNGDVNVGIALYYGEDFGKHTPDGVASYFKGEFDQHGITSKVFIKEHEHGSTVTFFIDGETFSDRPMNPAKAAPKDFIEGIAGESYLVHLFDHGAAIEAAPSQFRDWADAALKSRETMESWYK